MSVRNMLPAKGRRRVNSVPALAILGLSLLVVLPIVTSSSAEAGGRRSLAVSAEGVLVRYLQALYSRDAATSYALTAAADRDVKSQAEYRREQGELRGAALTLARELASRMRMSRLRVEVHGRETTLRFAVELPDANHPDLADIVLGFDAERLEAEDTAGRKSRLARLRALADAGDLPMLSTGDEVWTLVRDHEGWRVFHNWAGAVRVRFEAFTPGGLPWRFEPLQDQVFALPGDTLQMAYRATNFGAEETAGKARHIVSPAAEADYLEIVSCFCFMELTLAPGESVELPLVFRLDYMVPEDLQQLEVRYEFYPRGRFPQLAEQ